MLTEKQEIEGAVIAGICRVLMARFPQVEVKKHHAAGITFMVRETHGPGHWLCTTLPDDEFIMLNAGSAERRGLQIKSELERQAYRRFVETPVVVHHFPFVSAGLK